MKLSGDHTKLKPYIPYFLIAAISLSIMGIETHLPAMPLMTRYFGVSSSVIKYTISFYQFGMLAAALVSGPISDALGRRPIMIFGCGLFALCSLLICLSVTINSFLILRFMQGCGSGVAVTLGSAIIGECYSELEVSKILAQMSIIILFTPMLAPILGGYLTSYYGWHSSFILIGFLGTIIFMMFMRYFPETHLPELRIKLHIITVFKKYHSALSNKNFMAYALIYSLPSAGVWFVITTLPIVMMEHMGVAVTKLGFYIAGVVIVTAATSFYVQRVVMSKGTDVILSTGIKLFFMGGIATIFVSFAYPASPVISMICLLPFFMGVQFTSPAAIAKSMSSIDDAKGTGSACLSILRLLFSFLGSFVTAFLSGVTLLQTGIFLLFVACCIGIIAKLI
jgi:DHA1 family bicyclomycin/chloramphenicol resistance-like MFS transporter